MEIKAKSTILTLDYGEARCSITQLYDKIAFFLGYNPETVEYDQSKVACTPDIQEEIMAWYRRQGHNPQETEEIWKDFGPKGCLCEGIRTVMVEDGFVNVGRAIKTQLTEEMNEFFGLNSCEEFISSCFGEALEVYSKKGTIFALKDIVHLEDILGFKVSYELFQFIDRSPMYQETSLLDLEESDYDDLMFLCKRFAE